jgi:hypothetical protein
MAHMPELAKPKYEQSHAPKSTTVLYFNGDLTSVDSVMWVVLFPTCPHTRLDSTCSLTRMNTIGQ